MRAVDREQRGRGLARAGQHVERLARAGQGGEQVGTGAQAVGLARHRGGGAVGLVEQQLALARLGLVAHTGGDVDAEGQHRHQHEELDRDQPGNEARRARARAFRLESGAWGEADPVHGRYALRWNPNVTFGLKER
ncbi:hypothetical protein [Variovorax sp. UC122_21]|uniref:hypothetical protein n=1 Tax=Variovorax sp. UC122_21 TaxID=3374554 RepID=UPI0037566846